MRRHTRSRSADREPGSDLENNLTKEKELIKYPRFKKPTHKMKDGVIKEYLRDYTENSNLHGFKYIGEKERTLTEKLFWLFMIICSILLCGGLIRKVWIKWNESPVIVTIAENSTPVWQIPYPAVTFCFETKAMASKFNLTKYFHILLNNSMTFENFTEEEQYMYEDLSLMCDSGLPFPRNGRNFSSGAEIVNNINKVSPNLTDLLFGCVWRGKPMRICPLFSPIVTEDGLCYTSNILGQDELFRVENLHKNYDYLNHESVSENWTLDDGYPESVPLETYPRRGIGFGLRTGLSISLNAKETDLDFSCKGPVQSFKILLHNPAELPRLSQQYFRLPLAQEITVAVKPKMMVTSDGLRAYSPKIRQCYFPNERYLLYFKVYTQANCEMECISNFTNARCGCVHFGMPYGPNIKVCNSGSIGCMKNAQTELVTIKIQSKTTNQSDVSDTIRKAWRVAEACQCLPACTSIEYEAEISQAPFDWFAIYKVFNQPVDDEDKATMYSRAIIFFKEPQFFTSRRSELYGYTDFLANCGGLLGLFMGFSMLSVAEILYFLTLRIFCILWKKKCAKNIKNYNSGKINSSESNLTKQFYID